MLVHVRLNKGCELTVRALARSQTGMSLNMRIEVFLEERLVGAEAATLKSQLSLAHRRKDLKDRKTGHGSVGAFKMVDKRRKKSILFRTARAAEPEHRS